MTLRLRTKLSLFACALVLVATGSSVALIVQRERKGIAEVAFREARQVTVSLSAALYDDLYRLDLRALERTLKVARTNPNIKQSYLADLNGAVLVDGTGSNEMRDQKLSDDFSLQVLRAQDWLGRIESNVIRVGGPVVGLDGTRLGFLQIRYSLEQAESDFHAALNTTAQASLIGLGLSILLSFILGSRLTRPIFVLVEACRKIGGGQLDTRLSLNTGDEMDILARTINQMAGDLSASHTALQRKAQELTRSNEDLQQFAYVASHDLQEPLRMITSYTTLLAKRYKGKLDKDADEFIGFAVDGAKRMQGLILALLSYSRVGTKGKEFAPADCQSVLSTTLQSLAVAISESGAQISHDPLPTVRADAGQLGQLFQNLIGNAIKYRNGNAPQVHVSCTRQAGDWLFGVKDNGIGIDPQYAERVFVIFQRLHTRDDYAGTGIGLAVCKKIVDRHGGKIWLESELGKGATFYFTLPAASE